MKTKYIRLLLRLSSLPLFFSISLNASAATAQTSVQVRKSDSTKFEVRISLNYRHAVKVDTNGKASAAALYTCHNLELVTADGPEQLFCNEATSDPFNFANGNWNKAALNDGHAKFPVRHWEFTAQSPEGEIRYICNLMQTGA